jgi:hypothetical protein
MNETELANKAVSFASQGNALEFGNAMKSLIGLKLAARINTAREGIINSLTLK